MISPLPSGVATFLFTDIEGSTEKWETDSEAMAEALRLHDRICGETIEAAGGYIFKTTGDGCLAVFSDARSAVDGALSLRQRLAAASWPRLVAPLLVRMAIHSGPAELRDSDYFGPTLNRSSRLMSAGHGGQILVSEATRQMLPDSSYALTDLGEHRLPDLLQPEHIYQVGGAGERYPALRTLDNHPHNLPTQVSAFVGRENELNDLVELIPVSPLVTLTGPGGTGKTRLALQVAASLIERFNGVFFVPLASVRDGAEIGLAIAEALGLQFQGDADTALAAYLSGRPHLLVLDNFEQLVSAAPRVGRLLEAVSDVRIVVTSRELLHLRAEQNYPIAPLEVPVVDEGLSASQVARYEALRLFEVRAKAVRPDFNLDDSNVDDVAEICRMVDGLPLGIELAAARIRLFTAAQLRSGLASDLAVLGSGPRDAPGRHQSLIAAIEWSYELLDEGEKTTFKRLSVFDGGAGLDAFAAVVLYDVETHPATAAEMLADKSLVRVRQDDGAGPRVEMLETIRAFARSKLEAEGESTDTLRRHAAFFAELSERAESRLRGAEQEYWMARLDVARANLESALGWSFGEGDPRLGLRIVAALRDYWFYQGRLREMERWTDEAMETIGIADPVVEAGVRLSAGFLAYALYREDAADLLGRAASMYEAVGDDAHRALALIFEAGARQFATGDLEAARRGLERGIDIARRAGAVNEIALGLTLWGELERGDHNYKRALDIQEEALAITRETGEKRRVAMILNNLGMINHHLGDDQAAYRMSRESLLLSREIGFDANSAHCLIALAEQIALRGDPGRGALLVGAAEAYFDRIGFIVQQGDAPDFDSVRADIKGWLGDAAYRDALGKGRELSLENAIELALSDLPG